MTNVATCHRRAREILAAIEHDERRADIIQRGCALAAAVTRDGRHTVQAQRWAAEILDGAELIGALDDGTHSGLLAMELDAPWNEDASAHLVHRSADLALDVLDFSQERYSVDGIHWYTAAEGAPLPWGSLAILAVAIALWIVYTLAGS